MLIEYVPTLCKAISPHKPRGPLSKLQPLALVHIILTASYATKYVNYHSHSASPLPHAMLEPQSITAAQAGGGISSTAQECRDSAQSLGPRSQGVQRTQLV